MRAITFNVSVPGFLLGKGLGGMTESALFGGLSGVRLRELPEPSLPGDHWVKLDVLAAGICGTDLEMTRGYLPFAGILGHEFVDNDKPLSRVERPGCSAVNLTRFPVLKARIVQCRVPQCKGGSMPVCL